MEKKMDKKILSVRVNNETYLKFYRILNTKPRDVSAGDLMKEILDHYEKND